MSSRKQAFIIKEDVILNKNNNHNYNRVPGLRGRFEKGWLQQARSTHSGAEEKETLNTNVVGKNKTIKSNKHNIKTKPDAGARQTLFLSHAAMEPIIKDASVVTKSPNMQIIIKSAARG